MAVKNIKYVLRTWRRKSDRMNQDDKENLKILYHGLNELTEEERSFLMDKYLYVEDGKPYSDNAMLERYGMTRSDYIKKRVSIESKLDDIISPLYEERSKRRFQEMVDSWENLPTYNYFRNRERDRR